MELRAAAPAFVPSWIQPGPEPAPSALDESPPTPSTPDPDLKPDSDEPEPEPSEGPEPDSEMIAALLADLTKQSTAAELEAAVRGAGCLPVLLAAAENEAVIIRGSQEVCTKGDLWTHEGRAVMLKRDPDSNDEVELKWLDTEDSSFFLVQTHTLTRLPRARAVLANIAAQSVAGMKQLLSLAQSEEEEAATRETAATAVATGLADPDATTGQLEVAVAAGCVRALVGLLRSGKGAEGFAARALQKILLGLMKPAAGAVLFQPWGRKGTYATKDGARWGEVAFVDQYDDCSTGDVKLRWLDNGRETDDWIQPSTLQAVERRVDLVPAFGSWAGQVLDAGCIPPLLATFGPGVDGAKQLAAAGLVAALCMRATVASSQEEQGRIMTGCYYRSFARRLVAAGLHKDALVAADKAIGGKAADADGKGDDYKEATPAQKAKYRLEQLLKDTVMLKSLSTTERAELAKDKNWEDLTYDEQQAAYQLGWEEHIWDHGEVPEQLEGCAWDTLMDEQQAWGKTLNYDQANWDWVVGAEGGEYDPQADAASDETTAAAEEVAAPLAKDGSLGLQAEPEAGRGQLVKMINWSRMDQEWIRQLVKMDKSVEPEAAEPEPEVVETTETTETAEQIAMLLATFSSGDADGVAKLHAAETIATLCMQTRSWLKPADGTATDASAVMGAAATLDGARWGEVTLCSSSYIKLNWLDNGDESDDIEPVALKAVVAKKADLRPVTEAERRAAARRLVEVGLSKGVIAAAASAIGGQPEAIFNDAGHIMGTDGCWRDATTAEKAKDKLEQLLMDTALLSALAQAEHEEAEAEAETDEAAHPMTEAGTRTLVEARMARHQRQSEPQEGATVTAAAFHNDCSLSPGQVLLAEELAPHVLNSRQHRAAIAGMVDGGTVPCDCLRFVARFLGTNRPRDDVAEDVQAWRCSNCRAGLPAERVALEEMEKTRCEREDAELSGGNPHADRLRSFGLSVEFILVVTVAFDCWTWPTWKVQRDIIRPLCLAGGRCRFAELPWVMSNVGPADVFISHTWSACWGTLVAAALNGAAVGRKVWVDNVAVRQFPGNMADLDFGGVIEQCKAVLLVAQALPGVAGLELKNDWNGDKSVKVLKPGQAIPKEERSLVAACRVWCLAEIDAAMRYDKPLVVMAGSAVQQTEANGRRSAYRFVADGPMLRNMPFLIDIESADATVAADKEMILSAISQQPGGTAAMNTHIKSELQTAHELSHLVSVDASAAVAACLCGEPGRLALLSRAEAAEALRGAVAAGQAAAVSGLLLAGASIEAPDADGMTGWWLAVEKGHAEVVRVLLAQGKADVEARDTQFDGSGTPALAGTALISASGANPARSGHAEVVRVLLTEGKADVEAKDEAGYTALMWAVRTGHVDVLQVLLDEGMADVDAKARCGRTSLICAVYSSDPKMVKILLAAKADFRAKDNHGSTALDEAVRHDSSDDEYTDEKEAKQHKNHKAVINLLREAEAE
jgi:hypothetical protein